MRYLIDSLMYCLARLTEMRTGLKLMQQALPVASY